MFIENKTEVSEAYIDCLQFLPLVCAGVGVACIFLRLVVCQLLHLLLFFPILKAVFSFCLFYIYCLLWTSQMAKR